MSASDNHNRIQTDSEQLVTFLGPAPSDLDQDNDLDMLPDEQGFPFTASLYPSAPDPLEHNELQPDSRLSDDDKITGFIRIRTKDLCVITRQLASLLQAGLALVPALMALVEQLESVGKNSRSVFLARIFRQIADRVNSGSSLADALRHYPRVFSNLYVNMVRAGQAGGTLEDVLLKLTEMLEKRARLTARLQAALVYPVIMIIAAFSVVIFLMAFVVPGITDIFVQMNRSLPWPTTLLMGVCAFIRNYLWLLALIIVALVVAVSAYLKTPGAKMNWDRWKLKLPYLGAVLLKIEMIRLTRTLGIMLTSGISILDALQIVKGVVQNRYICASLENIHDDLGRGHSLAQAVRQTALFPPILIHTLAVGQMSGSLEQQLLNLAEGYDEEINVTVRSLTALLEPVILLFMGLVVGFIVLATLLPIFEINQML